MNKKYKSIPILTSRPLSIDNPHIFNTFSQPIIQIKDLEVDNERHAIWLETLSKKERERRKRAK